MNRSVFTLLILAGAVSACDNSAPIKSSDIKAYFNEYCQMTGGSYDSTKDICKCGAIECENRGCKARGMECEDRELCSEEDNEIYKEEDVCVLYKCVDGFYQLTQCNDGVSCTRKGGEPDGCGECKNGTSSCTVIDGTAYIDVCVSGKYEHRKCGSKYCYNGNCAECLDGMHTYRQENGLCQKYECQSGSYVAAKINDCLSNVSCKYNEDGEAECGECNDSDYQSECIINDESQKAVKTKCIKGEIVKIECENKFCYNNACAECSEGMKSYKQEDNRCYSYTCHNGFFDKKDDKNECDDDVSCTYSENGVISCGKCLNSDELECKADGEQKAYFQYCKNGELGTIECDTPACSSDNKACVSCGKDEKICFDSDKRSQTIICLNHKQSIEECPGSCNGNKCGVCKNGTIQCKAEKLEICEHGDWIDKNKDENGCFTHNNKTYYCENSTTYKECTSTCYNNQCFNKNQGVIVTDNAVVRRTPVITKVEENNKSNLNNYIVGYLKKGTIVDVVGKTTNNLYLLRFEKENKDNIIISYKQYGSWEDGKEYYYLKNDDIWTENKSPLEPSEIKIYFSKIPKVNENFDKQFFEVNYDGTGNKLDNKLDNVYDDVLKETRKKAFKEAFDADPKPVENLESLTSIKEMYPDIASNWTIDQYYIYNGKWKKNKSDVPDMTEELRTFFTDNNNNKSRIVIARVGSESSNESSGMWNYLHYITIYGYDSGFKYNDQKGLFYIKDTIWGKQKHCVGDKCAEYKSFSYKPFYATHENIPSQATQFYFFEKK